ncbi:MAG TPA: DUF4230 domain-containing protein [Acidimicrobiia bacterium]|nr:DUF4230 domain-containing protein [Acidimicrobiia bacterium]
MPLLAPDREYVAVPAAMVRTRSLGRRSLRGAGLVMVAVLALVGLDRVRDLIPSLGNPFATETVDRTGPAVLKALEDLHRYEGATGSFQVYVDVEKDAKYVPAILKGQRTLFLAAGSVEAGVDFSALGDGAVEVAPDGQSVTVTLPHARLSEPRVDPGQSRVVDRDRGILDRLGSVFSDSPTSERELYLIAEPKLAAAASESGLVERAEENTRKMLEALLAPLGVAEVHVTFVDDASRL